MQQTNNYHISTVLEDATYKLELAHNVLKQAGDYLNALSVANSQNDHTQIMLLVNNADNIDAVIALVQMSLKHVQSQLEANVNYN